MTKSRLEAFSDGVLAIAITLLVIDLRPPQLEPGKRLAHALWQHWPSYVAYLVSFLTIGVLWLNHHWILEQVVQVDGPLLVLNLNVLLRTALLPFPTAVLAEHLGRGRGGPDGGSALQRGADAAGPGGVPCSPGSSTTTGCIGCRLRRWQPPGCSSWSARPSMGPRSCCHGCHPCSAWPYAGRWRSTTAATTCAVDQAPTLAEPDRERSRRSHLVSRSGCATAHPAGVVLLACAIICFKALAQPPW